MNQFYPLLKTNPLFYEFEDEELSHLLSCLRAGLAEYNKDDTILLQGNKIFSAGIVVRGSACSHRVDMDGCKRILRTYNAGDVFCEELLLANIIVSPFTLIACEQTSIIYIDCMEIPKFCNLACVHHSKFASNLLQMLSEKIVQLERKMEIVQKSRIRGKIIAYLLFCAEHEGSSDFIIPFSRQELADYLGVNRSALSRELRKMQNEGIVSFDERNFTFV